MVTSGLMLTTGIDPMEGISGGNSIKRPIADRQGRPQRRPPAFRDSVES
jgi:hypothetical protein